MGATYWLPVAPWPYGRYTPKSDRSTMNNAITKSNVTTTTGHTGRRVRDGGAASSGASSWSRDSGARSFSRPAAISGSGRPQDAHGSTSVGASHM